MKYLNTIIGGCVLILSFTACTDKFNDMNTDKHSITQTSPAYTLPYVEEIVTNVDCTPYQRGENLYTQMYAQYFANTVQGWTSDRYGYNDGWAAPGFWDPYYLGLKHLKVLKADVTNNPSYTNYYAMMRIIVAWRTIAMTDIFGDIPYSEAGLGQDAPRYDSQKDIYYDVFKELTEATVTLKQNLPNQEACGKDNDLIYEGNISKWIKFANSLRLRYALRLYYIDPDKAKSEGEAALKESLMESNDDSAQERITAGGGWGHPLYMICAWSCFTMSKTMENIFKNTSTVQDPRMPMWFGQTVGYVNNQKEPSTSFKGLQFQGVPNGISDDQLLAKDADGYANNNPDNNSYPWGLQAFPDWNSKGIKPDNTVLTLPLKIMGYSEVCFLKAEAALRGWSGAGDVKSNYVKGIRASFEEARTGVDASLYSTAEDETYINTGNVAWDEGNDTETKLNKIITQKWIALYPDGNEAWAEFRRTGYPKLSPVAQSLDSSLPQGTFVKKIRYIDAERRDNPNAKDASLNGGKGDGMAVRVWWDTARYQ